MKPRAARIALVAALVALLALVLIVGPYLIFFSGGGNQDTAKPSRGLSSSQHQR